MSDSTNKGSGNSARNALFGALCAVAVMGAALLLYGEASNRARAERTPSELFSAAPGCDAQGESAGFRAATHARAARARWQRHRFDPGDGVAAVRSLERAIACWKAAGDEAAAQALRAELTQWKRLMERRYRAYRLRLRQALAEDDADEALAELRGLRALLSHRDDDYTAWLERTERTLRMQN